MPITPARATAELRRLIDEATNDPEVQRDGPAHDRWKASALAVLHNSLPAPSDTLQQFKDLGYHIGIYSGAPGEAEEDRAYFAGQVRRASGLLEAGVYELSLANDSGAKEAEATSIFVVHGHDDAAKYEVIRLLDRTTALSVVVLHEQPNRGATVIEKFEHHAGDAAFAVVLLTPDDLGRAKDDPNENARARQNVVFEMGAFVGLLGRRNVTILYGKDVELPSDLAGLVYIPLDLSKAWRLELLKEIEAAGIEVDRSRIP